MEVEAPDGEPGDGAPEEDAGPGPVDPEADAGDPEPDAGTPPEDAGTDASEPEPVVIGGLTIDTPAAEQTIDLFAHSGHRFWMQVSDEQLQKMNYQRHGGPGIPIDNAPAGFVLPYTPVVGAVRIVLPGGGDGDAVGGGDVPPPFPGGGGGGQDAGWEPLPEEDPYDPPGEGSDEDATYVDHMVVQDVESGSVADYGKVKVRLVGESTGRDWSPTTIPNLRIDTDGFTENMRLGGFEHIRLNNGQVGTIFRESLAHQVYRAMGYPGLRSSWAVLGSNVWGEDAWIPMTLMEVYKLRFCDDNQELVGGTCVNMWEFPGDVGWEVPGDGCQVSECDDTKLEQLHTLIAENQPGPGFKAALADVIDWDRFHQFQCLSWIMWTGDDALHNSNNNLIIERDDGKLVWAPYSVDISAGQHWYTNTSLFGTNSMATGCQQDPDCWADTLTTCEELIQKFDELNPELLLDQAVQTLTDLDMMRDGDVERAQNIRDWFVWRQENLLDELQLYLYPPGTDCPEGLERCADDTCGTAEECEARLCQKGEEWCENFGYCINPEVQFCPVCDELSPYYCPPAEQCVMDEAACDTVCKGWGVGMMYCPDARWCYSEQEGCPIFEPGPK